VGASCGPGARQRRAGLPDLLGALCALTGGGEPEAELRRLLAAALRLCRAQSGLLALRPPGPPLLLAGSGKSPGPEDAGRLSAVLAERFRGKLAIWKEAGFEPFWPGQPVNFLSAPVRSGEADYGLLGLARKRGGFSASDLELAAQVASCAAACLVSAEQRARAEQALTHLEALWRLGRDLLAELRLEPVLAAAKQLTGAELGMVAIFDGEARLIQSFGDGSEKCRVDPRLRCPRFLAKYLGPSPVIANDLTSSHLPQGHLPVTSALSVALPVGPQHSGCLMLANKPGGGFSPQDARLLETLAPCALLALLAEEGPGATEAAAGSSRAHREALRDLGHELKTPLSALALCHDLLASGRLGPLRPKQRHALQSARGSLDRLRAACTRMVDLACLRWCPRANLRQVDLAEVAREAVAAIEPLATQQGLVLEAEVPGSLPIQGDAERLRQLLDNLLSNAVKYTRPGGRVRLRAFAGAGGVRVEVADTGLGIGQGERERVFDRFFRGSSARHSAAQGHGLGLSIVREIVEMHGGSLNLESSPGAGTTFSIALPSESASG
jgi:signal transduction histidine kinase